MDRLAKFAVSRFVNPGTPLFLMGIMWLYLWVFPWRAAYLAEPHWGHNYTQALAFLCAGLAYFNRRILSDALAFLAALLVIPASLELAPFMVTAGAGVFLAGLLILDMIAERGRKDDLGQPANRRLAFWLKKHLFRFALIMLAHIAFIHFLVRLPGGTYETDLVTRVFNAMTVIFVILALLDGAVQKLWTVSVPTLTFFWGMATIVVALVILSNQPATWGCLAISIVVTLLAVAALVVSGRAPAGSI